MALYNWPDKISKPAEIPKLYGDGLIGCAFDQDDDDEFCQMVTDSGGTPDGQAIATDHGFADDGEGELSIPFIYVAKIYPHIWPGPAQVYGDCVSHSGLNACAASYGVECALNQVDPVTGKVERLPGPEDGVTEESHRQGLWATETHYGFRNKSSHGWNISACAKVMLSKSGLVIRKNYPDLGIDLTRYPCREASKWGAKPPPPEVVEMTSKHLFRTATKLTTWEEWRAYLSNGFCLGTDGGENFSKSRDENGVTTRKGKAAHSMAVLGFDDRDETKAIYGSSLALFQNSWGRFYRGGNKIRNSRHSINDGAFWVRTSEISRGGKPTRRAIAFASAAGWSKRTLPDLNPNFK